MVVTEGLAAWRADLGFSVGLSGWVEVLQNIIQSLEERRQIDSQDIPEDVEINGIVSMDEAIA